MSASSGGRSSTTRSRRRAPPYSPMPTFTAVVVREEDAYVATCPEIGTASQGATIEEAVANLREATELYLDEFPIDVG